MLEDVPGIINPIIHAMIASHQNQQETANRAQRADQLKQEAQYKQAELKHQDAQLAELERQHDQTMQYNRDMMEKVHIPQLQALLEHQGLENYQAKLGLLKGGANIDQQSGQVTLPSSPQEALEAELNEIRQKTAAQTSAQLGAQQPYLDAAEVRKERAEDKRLAQEHSNRLEELVTSGHITGQNALDSAKIHGQYQLAGDRLNGENHLRGIMLGMGGDVSAADKANSLLKNIYSGQTDYKDLPINDKKLVDTYIAGTGETVPTNGKDYKAGLDRVASMQELLNKARDLAVNYSRDTPGGSTLNKITGGHIPALVGSGVVPGTDLDSKIKDLKSYGGQLVTQLEGMRRSSDADILRQVTGVFDPGATKEQNLQKINSKISSMHQILKNDTAGLPVDRINKALGDRGITDFGLKPQVNAIKMPDGSILPDTTENRQKAGIQ